MILVTGATGFLGSRIVDRLLHRGETNLRVLVRSSSSRQRLDEVVGGHPGAKVEVFVGSLGSKERAAEALDGCNVVVHAAAALSGAPADICLNTVVTTRNLLEAMVAQESKPTLVHISSFGVYGVACLPRATVVNERTQLETNPERRDTYSQAKLRQELLVWEYHGRHGLPVVILRPGVVYGPNGSAFSTRVGLNLFGLFLHLGGDNLLPITYVDNCAEAIALAAQSSDAVGEVYNVVDNDLVTAAEYLTLYKREVKPLKSVRVPYVGMLALSALVERYHTFSKGQLPAIFTPYKTAVTWKGNRFDNGKLRRLGWAPIVGTQDGLARTFAYLRQKAS
ncbi:MAG: NAD(P)-dependent oxidoreductase [Myxococcales bacterium]